MNVEVFDNFLDSEEIYYLQEIQKPWVMQDSEPSNPYNLPFLSYTPSKGEPYFYKRLFKKIKKKIGKYSIGRLYFNGQSYGQDGAFHVDNCDKTVLIYVSPYDWEWGGFTQVGEEIIAPITGRMIAFDGMTPHKGFSFSRQTCPMRISLAYKLISK